ncbi:NERD domain-containing protein [Deinococcus cavernae]|uniref:NERD domain-containing protein n=1 Tax=Deinococcus cavernae TaxID=2320857 RepID=A0A418VEL1_9DEIO|nr:nuclease-related domain-containing protein [Deinococcus cavernae]RJF74493.1 NERD domain-containing protein [Deinococcus cavernae]
MIVKEYQAVATTDKFKQAGDKAEGQMAFYLRRAFGTDPNVHVFNNLRLEHDGEVGQIDHLIVHRGGMIIVESKSVTSAVRINDREEWSRQWQGRWQGMASPVLQAQRQADFLRGYLNAHKEGLLNKMIFGKQPGFRGFLIDVLVAISDQGVIEAKGDRPEVRKADQIPDQVKELLREHASLSNVFSLRFDKRAMNEGFNLAPDELTRLIAFLRNKHVEAGRAETVRAEPAAVPQAQQQQVPAAPAPPVAPSVRRDFKCRHCQGQRLQVQFGKSYYFKCLDCEGNTAIHLTCTQCGAAARTRKQGKEFFAECPGGHSERYFVNP